MVMMKEQQNQEEKQNRACGAAAHQVTTQAGVFREISTPTTGKEVTSVKRKRLLWRRSGGQEGPMEESGFRTENEPDEQKPHLAAQELGNKRGAGAMSHPNPRGI